MQAERVRLAQAGLSRRAQRELAAAWDKLLRLPPDKVADALKPVLVEIVEKYGSASGALAADWFDEMRELAGVEGRFAAQVATLPSAERLEVLARWGIGPLFGADPDPVGALTITSGALDRMVLGVGRETTQEAVAADPAQPRYARHASANACAFCAMLATRGAVYTSVENAGGVTGEKLGGKDYRKMPEQGVGREQILAGSRARTVAQGGRKGRATKRPLGEKYHDACHCVVVPVWGDEYEEAPYVARWREAYAAAPAGTKATLASMRADLGTN